MSYKLYIEGYEMELKDISRLAQTKHRNNITNLHTRQTNATNNFALPKTPTNVRNLEMLGVIGNNSTRPYKKLNASLQDTVTGEWLIYNGWANITSTANDFKVTLYDGIIDFYKAIDNKTLTDINISGLSHVKTLANITASFANTLPYMYILADFNGNNYSAGTFNVDYQVPSARVSYIWDRIHQFAGFTYSGAIFQNQRFLNWFITFPKPVPTTGTNYVNIETHNTGTALVPYSYYSGNAYFSGTKTIVVIFPNPIPATAYFQVVNNRYKMLQAGVFRLKIEGGVSVTTTFLWPETVTYTTIGYYIFNAAGTILSNGTIDSGGLGYVILNLEVGDQIGLYSSAEAGEGLWPGTMAGYYTIKLDTLTGYQVNFDDVLVDFLATDFVKEVLNHFALTPFKDKYSNHIEYKQLKEIIQEPNVVDWSDKNPVRLSEKYFIGNYAQANEFTYRYDDENLRYNNGYVKIDNQNLKENTVVVQSKLYTPSSEQTTLNGKPVNTYKIWDKEIDDAGVVKYKELTGRFYTLRSQMQTSGTLTLKSVATSQTVTFTGQIPYATNWRLNWAGILTDHYKQITQILNTAKFVEANLYLTSKDIADFDFKRLIYIEQWSSYYIVNKIVNFIKGKYTKVELLEVDYYTEDDGINYIIPYTFINITSATISGCTITVNFITDAQLPINISAEIVQSTFVVIGSGYASSDVYTVTATTNTIVFTFSSVIVPMSGASIKLWLGMAGFGVGSNAVPIALSSCVIPNPLTFLTLVSLQTIAIIPGTFGYNIRRIQVTFASDLPLPNTIRFWYDGGMFGGGQQYQDIPVTSTVFTVDVSHESGGIFGGSTVTSWLCYLQKGTIVSNQIYSNS